SALPGGPLGERFRVSLGVLGLLAEVAEEEPVLCLVDDAQWLDQASADALLFTARRLVAEPIALVFSARDDPERPVRAPGLADLRPAPLEAAEVRALIRSRSATALAPGAVQWLLESAQGNPLALVELPASLTPAQLAGHDPVGSVPPTTSVEETYLERVRSLPPPTRDVLLVAAAEVTGDRATIARAAETLGLADDALVHAERRGLVGVGRARVDFRHPLVRSAVYRGSSFLERERAHRALAAALERPDDADRRAWHLAAATVGPDADVADELERTATRA